jgi:glycosyltransferase involved in cell wall biosynthesis
MNDKPTCHLLSLPHTQTVRAFDHCAYTSKTRKLASMLHDQGYRVILYAGDENEARCDELVCVMSRRKQRKILKGESWYRDGEIYALPYDENTRIWREYNERAIKEIRKRIEPHDLILLPSSTHKPVQDAFPAHQVVESGIGYERTCAPYRVFESYAWMHTVYGYEQGAANADGKFYDAVIPNFFEVEDFPLLGNGFERLPSPQYGPEHPEYEPGKCGGFEQTVTRSYFLFASRMTPRKGYEIAIEATRRAGAKLLIAGVGGDRPEADHVEYVGLADTEKRAELMGGAKAIFVPTLYVEPFGGVAVESMLTGTPVICTDFGAFTENIKQGVDGFRCHTLAEFVQATHDVEGLDRDLIRQRAIERFSTEAIGPQYAKYFDRLQGLWSDGWYAE